MCGYAGSAGGRVHLVFCAFIANGRAADDIKTQVRERQRETELGLGTEGRKESVACLARFWVQYYGVKIYALQ